LGGEWLDGTGTVPLSESSEAYEVDVLNGPPAVARTYAASGGTASVIFDGNPSTWTIIGASPSPRTAEVTFATPQTIRQYGLRGAAGTPSESPNAWTVEGWNGTAWDLLDTRSGITGWAVNELRKYSLAAPATYARLRIAVTALNGGSWWNIPELAFYATVGGPDIAAATYAQAVVRTIAVTAPSATYSAANQTTDFGAAQAEVVVRLQQISALVGRGLPAEATL
jgi:hypothetical protein